MLDNTAAEVAAPSGMADSCKDRCSCPLKHTGGQPSPLETQCGDVGSYAAAQTVLLDTGPNRCQAGTFTLQITKISLLSDIRFAVLFDVTGAA